MRDKLNLIQDLVDNYIPVSLDGEDFRNSIISALNGVPPEKSEDRPHKCIYVGGVCDCGFLLEDHDRNYPEPKLDVHGLRVGSEAYERFYRLSG